MARYPKAIWKPVARYKPGGSSHIAMSNPRRLCYHTAVSSGDSLFLLFNTPGNAVAHFYVREDGKVEQYVDTNTRASANLDGNHDTISVESWDDAGRRETWTAAQEQACAELAVWVHNKHGIPLQPTDAAPGSRGITWHRKGIDGNFPPGVLSGRKPAHERWSKSTGKICPFNGKILGIVNVIIPTARRIAEGDWFDMATKAELREVVEEVVAPLKRELAEFRKNEYDRDQRMRELVAAVKQQTA